MALRVLVNLTHNNEAGVKEVRRVHGLEVVANGMLLHSLLETSGSSARRSSTTTNAASVPTQTPPPWLGLSTALLTTLVLSWLCAVCVAMCISLMSSLLPLACSPIASKGIVPTAMC